MRDLSNNVNSATTLVLGANGKTGRRVASRLAQQGVPVRAGSRRGSPRFDWNDRATWADSLDGVRAVYISYASHLPIVGSADVIGAFVEEAKRAGVARLVLLSGRGEEEGLEWERRVRASGLEWTVVRSSWFAQNFSEGGFADMVHAGQLVVPGNVEPEPYIDIEDLADVAAAALTESGHVGMTYEVTGPRLMTFEDVAGSLSSAVGQRIVHVPVSHEDFLRGAAESGAPAPAVELLDYLFGTLLDGRNAYVASGVNQALGRPARDFADFARATAAGGAWRTVV